MEGEEEEEEEEEEGKKKEEKKEEKEWEEIAVTREGKAQQWFSAKLAIPFFIPYYAL